MIRKQNILATIMIYLNQPKSLRKTLYQETTSKSTTSELFSKIPNRRKISNEQFYFCEAKSSSKLYKHFFK